MGLLLSVFGVDFLSFLVGFGGRFGIVLGSVWDWFGIGLGSVWDRFWSVLGSFWDRFGIGSGPFWDRFGNDFGIYFLYIISPIIPDLPPSVA